MSESARTAIARRRSDESTAAVADVRNLITRQQGEISKALKGTALNGERFTRVAMTVIRRDPKLLACRPESLLGALMTAAQLGLEPGPLGEAWFVPYKDEVTFIAGYRGLVKLAWQSGMVRHIGAAVVRDGDHFIERRGLHPDLVHEPARGNNGAITDVYAAALLSGAFGEFETLTVPQVEAARARSRAAHSGPWVSDWEPMAKKTAVRRLAPWLPMAVVLQRALAVDETTRTDLAPDALDVLEPGMTAADIEPAHAPADAEAGDPA